MKKLNLIPLMILLVVGCTAFALPLKAARENPGSPIVGLWIRTATDPNNPDVVLSLGFQAYHSDHTEMINDTNPPTAGNNCLGVWTQAGARTFKLAHTAWLFDSRGNATGTFRVRETVTVDPSGESYSGTNEIAVCDINLENCADIGTFDVHGVRRHVDF
jgi:hypothetical protein